MRKCVMGIDFGTSKIAAVLVDLEKKEVYASGSKIVESNLRPQNSRHREQSISKIKEAFFSCIESVLSRGGPEVLSIGLTGQMHGILGLDREGKAATNFVTWQDERGNLKITNGKNLLENMEEKGGKRPIASGYGIVTLYDWILRDQIHGISKICTIPDYFGMLLTGNNHPVMDCTMAHSIGSYDINSGGWDFDYISDLGIDRGYFPDVAAPTIITGRLKQGNISGFFEKGGIPVSVSIGDNQASFIGSVKDYYKSILINIGTGSQISFCIKSLEEQESIQKIEGYDVYVRPFIENSFLVAGNALSGGVAYSALKDFFIKTGIELFDVGNIDNIWERMENLASIVKEEDRLCVYPLFAGKRSDPEARGRIDGISLDNLTPSNLIYGTLEGIVRILRDLVDESVIGRMNYLIGSGNGLRKNTVLRKVSSTVFRKEIMIPLFEEEAAVGAALNGAVAAGIIGSFNEANDVIKYGPVTLKGKNFNQT